jgi:uncharacterized protein YcgI (DUF1989 family)
MNWLVADNPSEHFYSSKTRQIHATHISTGDRLWSNMPYIRPLATITHDTIAYGWDEDGAGVHDVIGSRCDPYTNYLMTGGGESHVCCHSNLTRQALRDGLKETDVHDVLNVFMCTGLLKIRTSTLPAESGTGRRLSRILGRDRLAVRHRHARR